MIINQLSFINNPKIRIAAVVLIVAIATLFWFFVFRKPIAPPEVAPPPPSPFITMQTGMDLAFAEARKWHEDAKLVKIFPEENTTDTEGRSTSFYAWFSSASASSGTGFEVVIKNRAAASAKELELSRIGGEMPQTGFLSQSAAIVYMHTLKGYEDAEVEYMDLFYERATGQWFWGIKTPKGELSVLAGETDQNH